MPAYEYQAINAKNKATKGIIEADSLRQVRSQLREQGLIPTTIKPLSETEKERGGKSGKTKKQTFKAKGKLKSKDIITITRQLANLIRASLPIDEALKTIAEHNNTIIRKTLSETRSRVVEGASLSKTLHEQRVFPEEYGASIAAGEQSGELATVLEKMAEDVERRHQFIAKMKTAMIYPIVIVIVSIVMVVALLTYVVPQVVEVFTNSNRELPALTTAMINISDFLKAKGATILFLLLSLFLLFQILLKSLNFRRKWHKIIMKIPIFGKIFVGSNNSQFARNFSLMLSAGVPVLEAMRIGANTLTCLPMQEAVKQASEMVREGSSIFRSLQKFDALPPMTLYMLASGERSGQIPSMLERAAINQEHELEDFTQSMLAAIEPLIILVMGGIVLLIVLSILLPIFQLNQFV